MKKITILTAVVLLAINAKAQKDVRFTINHLLGDKPFALNTAMTNNMGDELKIARLEYYISDIKLVHDGGQITSALDVYMLARGNKNDTITLGNFDVTTIEAIQFAIGVDPGVNNGDPSAWASVHPLAPKNPSMHWGWTAGYRFVAIEGKSGTTFNQDFQIHALGNKNYFKQSINTGAVDVNNSLLIAINADYTKAVSGMSMAGGLIEHGETDEAAACLRNYQLQVFTSTTGESSVASARALNITNGFSVQPVPSTGLITLKVKNKQFSNATYRITNLLGAEISTGQVSSETSLAIINRGIYFVTLTQNGVNSTKKIVIH